MKTISNNVFTPSRWVRVFGKEIHIPDKAFKECLHDAEYGRMEREMMSLI